MLADLLHKKHALDDDELNTIKRCEKVALSSESNGDEFLDALLRAFKTIMMTVPVTQDEFNFVLSDRKRQNEHPLDNYEANRRGLTALRVAFSHYALRHRGREGDRVDFTETGLVFFENFLGKSSAERVAKDLEHFPLIVHKTEENIISKLKNLPTSLSDAAYHSGMREEMLHCIKRVGDPIAEQLYADNLFVQRVENIPGDKDQQKDPHTDIFFPAIKLWYWPEEVKLEHGPLNYAKTSSKLTPELLEFWYDESVKVAEDDDYIPFSVIGHREGSFRVNPDQLKELGYEMSPITVEADTLVFGNVFGFHARGDAEYKNIRNALHCSIRVYNPFAP